MSFKSKVKVILIFKTSFVLVFYRGRSIVYRVKITKKTSVRCYDLGSKVEVKYVWLVHDFHRVFMFA